MYKEHYENNRVMPGQTEKDELRARFTGWLDITLYRAKLKYLEKQKQPFELVSFDEFPADLVEDPIDYYTNIEHSSMDFDFEEETLAEAFSKLPSMRRAVCCRKISGRNCSSITMHRKLCSFAKIAGYQKIAYITAGAR